MYNMINVIGNKYYGLNRETHTSEKITKKQAEKIFSEWLVKGYKINRKYGRVIQVWYE